MLILLALVVVAVALILVVGRRNGPGVEPRMTVTGIDTDGLRIGHDPALFVPWGDVWEIAVITRRAVRGTWFGFELRADGHGLLAVDGSSGLGEQFLAESHRFHGFDHIGLSEALETRQARAVCFTR